MNETPKERSSNGSGGESGVKDTGLKLEKSET